MENHDTSVGVAKILLAWIIALGSITLAQTAVIVGIVSGLLAIIFTALQIYILWRDKIVKYRPPGAATRSTDLGPLGD